MNRLRKSRTIRKTTFVILLTIITVCSSRADVSKGQSDINTKVAQVNIGTATLDDAIRIFGEPAEYFWGGKTFTRDELPSSYIAAYPNEFEIMIHQGKVSELRFEGPETGYLFAGKLQVGSSLEQVLEVVGQPKQIVEGKKPMGGPVGDAVLYKDIEGRKGFCYYSRADQGVRFIFGEYKVTAVYLTRSARSSVEQFDDVRWKDLSKLDLSGRKDLVRTLYFNQETIWPKPAKMPSGCDPNKLLTDAMNPGLGVRKLHQQGITGKGVNVAIIDQATYLDHAEFAGKIVAYHDLASGQKRSMHGPAMASLLVGTKCGTAPGARVFYVAVREGVFEVDYAEGLDWITNRNKTLSGPEKIRVVSVSAAPGRVGTPSTSDQKKWDDAYGRAEAGGILVLECGRPQRFIFGCWYDADDPENVAMCTGGFPGRPFTPILGHILAPSSFRTTAEEYEEGVFGYSYCGRGGLSLAVPYCAGVLALGWQIRPDLTSAQMRDLLFKSAYTNKGGVKIINPKEYIRLVRKAEAASKPDSPSGHLGKGKANE
ncbi:MAG: S8 family serine peptidase [Planctomycetota bacterium]